MVLIKHFFFVCRWGFVPLFPRLEHSVVCVLCLCCARQGPAGNVYYLDLDVLETKCHTGSPKPWKRCDIRPFMETVGHTCTSPKNVCLFFVQGLWGLTALRCKLKRDLFIYLFSPSMDDILIFIFLHRVCSSCGVFFFHKSSLWTLTFILV